MLMPSRSRRYLPMRYAVRSVLADKPTTAHVAGVVNSRLITWGSRHVLTAQILADPAGVQSPGQGARSVCKRELLTETCGPSRGAGCLDGAWRWVFSTAPSPPASHRDQKEDSQQHVTDDSDQWPEPTDRDQADIACQAGRKALSQVAKFRPPGFRIDQPGRECVPPDSREHDGCR